MKESAASFLEGTHNKAATAKSPSNDTRSTGSGSTMTRTGAKATTTSTKKSAVFKETIEEGEHAGDAAYSTDSCDDLHSMSTVTDTICRPRLCESVSSWTVLRMLAFWGLLAGTIYVGLQGMSYATEREVEAMEDAVSLQPPQFLRPLL
jgi:hypothetical protein